jgi:adenine-specific DNA-methyltransferase
MQRLKKADRIVRLQNSIRYKRYYQDYPAKAINNMWNDLGGATNIIYVVQTSTRMIERCLLMTTDPGDLVLDPTCGSGTTAYVAEQWGRRWITIDTSRVALALARSRIMGARYPYYLLADSEEGYHKEMELGGSPANAGDKKFYNRLRHGFVYERVPHITLKSIANNAEIEVIWEKYQPKVEAALVDLNAALKAFSPPPFRIETGARAQMQVNFRREDKESEYMMLPSGERAASFALLEWEVPRGLPHDWTDLNVKKALETFWNYRVARQKEIDASSMKGSRTTALRKSFWKIFRPPEFNRSAKRTRSISVLWFLGRGVLCAPKAVIGKAMKRPEPSAGPPFLSARNSAPSPAPTLSKPHGKPPIRALTYSSPAPLTTKPTPRNLKNWGR